MLKHLEPPMDSDCQPRGRTGETQLQTSHGVALLPSGVAGNINSNMKHLE